MTAHQAVEFSEHVFETKRGRREALVVTPRFQILLDSDRLRDLRVSLFEGEVEQAIRMEARAMGGRPRVVVIRGRSDDGTATWAFDEELTEAEVRELAYWLLRAQIPLFRSLIGWGVVLVIHVDFGYREVTAYRQAAALLLREAEERARAIRGPANAREDAVTRADLWILRHVPYFFSTGFEKVMADTLPDMLPLLEHRDTHARDLASALPPAATAI